MQFLVPSNEGAILTVAEVVRRAQSEFCFVVTNESRAMRYLAEKLLARNAPLDHQRADEELTQFVNSVEMIVGDDRKSDERFLKCYVFPDSPIEVVYVFDGHEARCLDLLARLKLVLNYIFEPPVSRAV